MLQRGGGQHPDAPVPLEPREAHRRRGSASRGGVPSSLALTAACHPRAEYLCDADKVLKRAGIHQGENLEIVHADGAVAVGGTSQPRGSLPDVQCLICYETSADYSALGCGHQFCNTCYTTFLAHKITDEGYNCVFATCPKPEVCPAPLSRGPPVRALPQPALSAARTARARSADRRRGGAAAVLAGGLGAAGALARAAGRQARHL